MFHLKIENLAKIKSSERPLDGPNTQVVENENLRISTATDNLYSFYSCSGPNIIVGESLTPLSLAQLQEEFKKLIDNESLTFSNSKIPVIVMVNSESGEVRAYRNASGNRPLYFANTGDTLICASRLSGLKGAGLGLKLDETVVPEMLVYRLVTPPSTLAKGARLLPAGWAMTRSMSKSQCKLKSMWQILPENRDMTQAQAIDGIIRRLEHALHPLLESPGETCLLLSGGLDSSILGAICKRVGLNVKSVSSGFQAITGDRGESDYAKSAAAALGLDHTVYDVTDESYLESLVASIYNASEPIHHLQSAVLHSLFQSGIRPGVKYLISGEGADSLFCNTAHYRYWRWKSVYDVVDKSTVKKLIGPILRPLSRIYGSFAHFYADHSPNHENPRHFIWEMGAYGDPDWVNHHYNVTSDEIILRRQELLSSREYASLSLMDKITVLSLLGEADATMRIWGNLAESSGRIMIHPFTDPELISFAMSIPWELKAREPKLLLKLVAEALKLPEQIINRPKRSFGFPSRYWAEPSGLFQPLVEMAGRTYSKEILRSLQGSDPGKAMILWGFLNLYLWQRMFLDDVMPDAIKGEIRQRRRQAGRKASAAAKVAALKG